MALSDFHFFGSRMLPLNRTITRVAYNIGNAQGQTGATDGGYGMVAEPKARTSYSGTQIPSAAGGDYARCMPFSNSANLGGRGYKYTWGGGAALTSAAGGALYPVTQTPAQGTLVSQSVRAFLRLDATGAEQNQGASVGLFIKGRRGGSNNYNGINEDGGSQALDSTPQIWMIYGIHSGYHVQLTTQAAHGSGNFGTNAAPKLRFDATDITSISNTSANYTEDCTGTYALNTWYHVRMDCIPSLGNDNIKIYTAPVTDTVGSETWTEVADITIGSGAAWYSPWNDSNFAYAGYSFAACNTPGNYDDIPDASIDRFQFLDKDIS